ncbi:hypothetical protein AB0D49_40665 [Streptomyces sp. NPDC048290]|uniref:hypothetical protein n=1 Tax=Streptomyces sp. NPDC048290 TaxID=3155811 RepID=UPI0034193555
MTMTMATAKVQELDDSELAAMAGGGGCDCCCEYGIPAIPTDGGPGRFYGPAAPLVPPITETAEPAPLASYAKTLPARS